MTRPDTLAGQLSAQAVRQLLRYEPETGKLFWLERPQEFFKGWGEFNHWNRRFAHTEALTATSRHGYRSGSLFSRTVIAHRIIWLIQTGSWPTGQIDHVNGVRDDNRWMNLRDVSASGNACNTKRRTDNSSGVTGVYWDKSRRNWKALIKINGKQIYIGRFKDFADAVAARTAVSIESGFSARHGSVAQ